MWLLRQQGMTQLSKQKSCKKGNLLKNGTKLHYSIRYGSSPAHVVRSRRVLGSFLNLDRLQLSLLRWRSKRRKLGSKAYNNERVLQQWKKEIELIHSQGDNSPWSHAYDIREFLCGFIQKSSFFVKKSQNSIGNLSTMIQFR